MIKYEYCVTWEERFSGELGAGPIPSPKGEGWEPFGHAAATGGCCEDMVAVACIFWRKKIAP